MHPSQHGATVKLPKSMLPDIARDLSASQSGVDCGSRPCQLRSRLAVPCGLGICSRSNPHGKPVLLVRVCSDETAHITKDKSSIHNYCAHDAWAPSNTSSTHCRLILRKWPGLDACIGCYFVGTMLEAMHTHPTLDGSRRTLSCSRTICLARIRG